MDRNHARGLCVLALALALGAGACGGAPVAPSGSTSSTGPGSSGPASNPALDALRASATALASQQVGDLDVQTDELTTAMGVREALGADADQILTLATFVEDAARAEAPARITGAGSSTIVLAVAIMPSLVLPPVPPPASEVRMLLPPLLDDVGLPGESTVNEDPSTATANETDGTMTGATTFTTTLNAVITGSVVRLEARRDVHTVISDTATGAAIFESTRKYVAIAQIDVCPNVEGIDIASVDNTVDAETTTSAGARARVGSHATGNLTSTSSFSGKVDDTANLVGVSQKYKVEQTWHRTASADGGPEASHEGAFGMDLAGIQDGVPAPHDWSIQPADLSGMTGDARVSGDATTNNMGTAIAFNAAMDYTTIDLSFIEAQKLWRNDRCVVVTAPGYGAETEIRGHSPVSHKEDVLKGSTTEFEIGLKQRFGTSIGASVQAELDGKDTLTPGSIEKPPGTLRYVAPDEDGQDAIVRLTSTSKQGIGKLNLGFHTGAKSLGVTITGTMTTAGAGVSFVTTVSIPKIVLTKQSDGTYLGSGPGTTTVTIPQLDCAKPYIEKGTVVLRATVEKVADASYNAHWIVTFDPSSSLSVSGTCVGVPLGTFLGTGAAGPTAGFMVVLGKISLDEKGENKHVKETHSLSISTNTIDATVIGELISSSTP
jgi:hypothetical protein